MDRDWKAQIAGCFSSEDCKFASQFCDAQRARDMLIDALRQGVEYEEFCTTIKNWLCGRLVSANPSVAKDRVKNEMKKVRKLASYFSES